jgi:hypothetical protein
MLRRSSYAPPYLAGQTSKDEATNKAMESWIMHGRAHMIFTILRIMLVRIHLWSEGMKARRLHY